MFSFLFKPNKPKVIPHTDYIKNSSKISINNKVELLKKNKISNKITQEVKI
jgi:HJR/Mrr/RecB family endonuclease